MGEKKTPIMNSTNSFSFGEVTVMSNGMIELELQTPKLADRIAVLIDFVPVSVPALLGLDFLNCEC